MGNPIKWDQIFNYATGNNLGKKALTEADFANAIYGLAGVTPPANPYDNYSATDEAKLLEVLNNLPPKLRDAIDQKAYDNVAPCDVWPVRKTTFSVDHNITLDEFRGLSEGKSMAGANLTDLNTAFSALFSAYSGPAIHVIGTNKWYYITQQQVTDAEK